VSVCVDAMICDAGAMRVPSRYPINLELRRYGSSCARHSKLFLLSLMVTAWWRGKVVVDRMDDATVETAVGEE
jgi:hypothetical protein